MDNQNNPNPTQPVVPVTPIVTDPMAQVVVPAVDTTTVPANPAPVVTQPATPIATPAVDTTTVTMPGQQPVPTTEGNPNGGNQPL